MVDRETRKELAYLLVKLTEGEMPIVEFDQGATSLWNSGLAAGRVTKDGIIKEVLGHASTLTLELGNPRLIGRLALSKDYVQFYERIILFLESDLEYQWPSPMPERTGKLSEASQPKLSFSKHFFDSLRRLFSPQAHRVVEQIRAITTQHALQRESDVWPFLSQAEVEAELTKRAETKA